MLVGLFKITSCHCVMLTVHRGNVGFGRSMPILSVLFIVSWYRKKKKKKNAWPTLFNLSWDADLVRKYKPKKNNNKQEKSIQIIWSIITCLDQVITVPFVSRNAVILSFRLEFIRTYDTFTLFLAQWACLDLNISYFSKYKGLNEQESILIGTLAL